MIAGAVGAVLTARNEFLQYPRVFLRDRQPAGPVRRCAAAFVSTAGADRVGRRGCRRSASRRSCARPGSRKFRICRGSVIRTQSGTRSPSATATLENSALSSSMRTTSSVACMTSQMLSRSVARPRVVDAGRRAGYRNEVVHRFIADDFVQRVVVAGIGRLGKAVERIDRPGEPVTGEPILGGLGQDHPVARAVEGSGELQRLGHLAAGDQHGAGKRVGPEPPSESARAPDQSATRRPARRSAT